MNVQIISVCNQKVLVVDGDPQGSLTISLGNPRSDKLPVTLSDMMGKVST